MRLITATAIIIATLLSSARAEAQSVKPYLLVRGGFSHALQPMGVIERVEGKPSTAALLGIGLGARLSAFEVGVNVTQSLGRDVELHPCNLGDCSPRLPASLFTIGVQAGARPFGRTSDLLIYAGVMNLHHWSRSSCIDPCRVEQEFGNIRDAIALSGGARLDVYRSRSGILFGEAEVYTATFDPRRTTAADDPRRYSELRIMGGLTFK